MGFSSCFVIFIAQINLSFKKAGSDQQILNVFADLFADFGVPVKYNTRLEVIR